jgi:hypothetical protein
MIKRGQTKLTKPAKARMRKFDIFILIDRNSDSENLFSARTITTVVRAKEKTISRRSNILRKVIGRRCLISITMHLSTTVFCLACL